MRVRLRPCAACSTCHGSLYDDPGPESGDSDGDQIPPLDGDDDYGEDSDDS